MKLNWNERECEDCKSGQQVTLGCDCNGVADIKSQERIHRLRAPIRFLYLYGGHAGGV